MNRQTILFVPGWNVRLESYGFFLEKLSSLGQVETVPLFEEKPDSPLTIEDYLFKVREAYKRTSPDLTVAHSFGGKLVGMLQSETEINSVLLAPSLFRPTLKKRASVVIKIGGYKLSKLLKNQHIIRHIPKRLRGSADYQSADVTMRQTLLNVKDRYLSADQARHFKGHTVIIGYQDDRSVEIAALRQGVRLLKNGMLIELPGEHTAFYYDPDTTIDAIKVATNRWN